VPGAVAFASPHEAAAEVLGAARATGYGGLHALPFNRFDTKSTTWWLSPSSENPLVMADGIAPSSDRILLFRSPSYALSFTRRLQGQ
jgi:hypothetical protein